jgi:hypothetical protein
LASADRDDAATKYWISIPTWYEDEWHDYHTLLEETNQGKGNGKHRRNEPGEGNGTMNCLHLVPFSADRYTT